MPFDPFHPNIVTFVTYLDDGRLQLQVRSFVSPTGRPVVDAGYFSINGGAMTSSEQMVELAREMEEELGVSVDAGCADTVLRFVGDVADTARSRTNHVYRLTVGYEQLLGSLSKDEAIVAALRPEGIGRAGVWREDLDAIIHAGRLTSISCKILEAFPDLLPPARAP